MPLCAIWIFLLTGYCLSIVPRTDWYYPSRSFLGTITAGVFLFSALHWLKPKKLHAVSIVVFVFSVFCFGYQWYFHYRSREVFMQFETRVVGDKSPQVQLAMANLRKAEERWEEVLMHSYDAYKIVPPNSIFKSLTASKFWQESLLWGYRSSKKTREGGISKAIFEFAVEGRLFQLYSGLP